MAGIASTPMRSAGGWLSAGLGCLPGSHVSYAPAGNWGLTLMVVAGLQGGEEKLQDILGPNSELVPSFLLHSIGRGKSQSGPRFRGGETDLMGEAGKSLCKE